eukprot:2452676-Rhodomonas_salina.1
MAISTRSRLVPPKTQGSVSTGHGLADSGAGTGTRRGEPGQTPRSVPQYCASVPDSACARVGR